MDFNKPRIALYYDVLPSTGFRNDGANLFLHYNFKKLLDGIDVYGNPGRIAEDGGNVVTLSPLNPIHHFGSFDLNGLIDYGEDGLGIPLDWKIPSPNFYWMCDSHIAEASYQYRMKRAKEFDTVFSSHKPTIARLIEDGIPAEKIHYLPWAAEPMCYKPFPVLEKWDWSFIGHLSNEFRINLVDRFCKEFPVGINGYLGWRIGEIRGHNVLEDCAKKFSQSRIILNESIKDDMNMRTFEALACKKLLLTEDIPILREHFVDGKHMVLFNGIDDAVEKAKFYLAHTDERNAIANAGYEEFLAKHTYMHRVKEILKVCINYEPSEAKGELIKC